MNKTTTTMLMAAGLIVLAGCKTEVMRDRHFQGDPPQDDPVMRQAQQPPRPMENGSKITDVPAPAPDRGFRPMEGAYAGDGIEDETPRRRAPRRKAARKSVVQTAPGGVYIVKPGDTLGRIARRHHVSVKALRQANNRTPEQDRFLFPGTKLVIPGAKNAAPADKKDRGAAPRRHGKNTPKLNADGTYTMVRGDNIPKVARKFGIRARALQRANNLTDEETTRLQIGHKLVIPTGDDVKVAPRKNKQSRAKKPAPAPAPAPVPQQESVTPQPPPPPPAPAPAPADNGTDTTLPPPPAPADNSTTVLPPPAPVSGGTDFMPVAGSNTLEEFAAKHNTTVAEVIRLNPQVDPKAPISSYGMLYVPRAAK